MSDRIVFLKPYGPQIPDDRRRRHERQRRFCCCLLPCLIAVAAAVLLLRRPVASLWKRMAKPEPVVAATPASFPLEAKLDKTQYRHYDIVRIRVMSVDSRGKPVSDPRPNVVMLRDDEPVPTVGGMERVPLRYDSAAKEWVANWPIPWNAPEGRYLFKATTRISPKEWPWLSVDERKRRLKASGDAQERLPKVHDEHKSQCIALAPFDVVREKPPAMSPGLGALVLEATWDLTRQPIPLPQGGNGDWRAIFDWCEFLGANALWYLAGYTDGRSTKLSMERPWLEGYMDMVPKLAEEAKRRGIQFGAYAVSYCTYGPSDHSTLPAYDYAWDVRGGRVFQTMFVSLDDVRRREHLAAWRKLMAAPDGATYTGMDYLRTGSDGYEMVDEFVRDMSVEVPDGWGGWPRARRMVWLHGKVAARIRNPELCDRWDWFRARKTALAVKDIMARSESPKPLWCFMLGWQHGKQHGQDAIMFTDAGAAFNAVMLYEIYNREHYEFIVKSWGEYARPGQTNLVVGDTVNWRLHQSVLRPAGPEEMYRRITTATHMVPGELAKGVFIHDLRRLFMARRTGPYPGKEWALAGAAAISKLRMDWGLYPVRVTIESPGAAALGRTFTVATKVTNLTKETLHNVRVDLLPTEGVEAVSAVELIVGSVPAEGTERAAFQVRLPGHSSKRADRFMLATRVAWPQTPARPGSEELPQQVTAMRYVDGR